MAYSALLRRGASTTTLTVTDEFSPANIAVERLIVGGTGGSDPQLVREVMGNAVTLAVPVYIEDTTHANFIAKMDALDAFMRAGACTLEVTFTNASNPTVWDVISAEPLQPAFTHASHLKYWCRATLQLLVQPWIRTAAAATSLFSAAAVTSPSMLSLAAMVGTYRTPLTIDVESNTADDLHSLYVGVLPSAQAIAVSSIDTDTEIITLASNHGWAANDRVFVSAATLPGGLRDSIGYYVKDPSGATLKLSLTSGGAAVNITSSGTTVVLYPGMPPIVDAKDLSWTGSGETSYADSYARLDNAVEFQSTDYNPAAIDTAAYPDGDYLLLARVKAVGSATGSIKTDYTDDVITFTRTSFHYVELGQLHLPVRLARGTGTANLTVSVKSSSSTNGQEAVLDHLVFVPLSWGMMSYHPTTATADVTEVGYDPATGVTYVDDVADAQYANGGALTAAGGALVIASDNPEGTTRTHALKVTASYEPRYAWMR